MLQGKWEILLTLVSHSSSAMCWWERLIVELAAVAIPESLICSRLISPLLAVMKSSIVKRPGQFASWYWKKNFRLKDPAWIWILEYLDFFFWDNMRRIKTAFFRSFSSMRSTTLYQVIRHSVFKKSMIKKKNSETGWIENSYRCLRTWWALLYGHETSFSYSGKS